MVEVDVTKGTGTTFCRKHCTGIPREQQHSERLSLFQGIRTSRCNGSFPVPHQSPCMGAAGLHSMGFAWQDTFPAGIEATAALCSPQPCNCSLGPLGKSLCASVSPTAKWRQGYFTLLRPWFRSTGGSVCDAVFGCSICGTLFINKAPPLMQHYHYN